MYGYDESINLGRRNKFCNTNTRSNDRRRLGENERKLAKAIEAEE